MCAHGTLRTCLCTCLYTCLHTATTAGSALQCIHSLYTWRCLYACLCAPSQVALRWIVQSGHILTFLSESPQHQVMPIHNPPQHQVMPMHTSPQHQAMPIHNSPQHQVMPMHNSPQHQAMPIRLYLDTLIVILLCLYRSTVVVPLYHCSLL